MRTVRPGSWIELELAPSGTLRFVANGDAIGYAPCYFSALVHERGGEGRIGANATDFPNCMVSVELVPGSYDVVMFGDDYVGVAPGVLIEEGAGNTNHIVSIDMKPGVLGLVSVENRGLDVNWKLLVGDAIVSRGYFEGDYNSDLAVALPGEVTVEFLVLETGARYRQQYELIRGEEFEIEFTLP